MRKIILIVWGITLFTFTCAANSGFWKTSALPFFHWSGNPDFHQLFIMDIKFMPSYIMQKIGHFLGFAIFAIILLWISKKYRLSFALAVFYAILTEVFQLSFGRDGRIYDVAIDTLGIVVGLYFVTIANRFRATK